MTSPRAPKLSSSSASALLRSRSQSKTSATASTKPEPKSPTWAVATATPSGPSRSANEIALDLIKKWEGVRLEAYQDSVGVWTIGYGSTAGVQPGDVITEAQADSLLRRDFESHKAETLIALRKRGVEPETLTAHQLGALYSFVFNVGASAFLRSTMLRKLAAGDVAGAAREFPRWNRAGGKTLQGLTNRRADEMRVFLAEDAQPLPEREQAKPDSPEPRPERSTTVWASIAAGATYVGDLFKAIPQEAAWLVPALLVGAVVYAAGERLRRMWTDGV